MYHDMPSSLSGLFDNFSEWPDNDKFTDCNSDLKYISTQDELLIFNCRTYSKIHEKYFNKYLAKRFSNTYEFCDADINTFTLMLKKGAYPHENMDS